MKNPLKDIREKREISQRKLEKLLRMPQGYYNKIENGKYDLSKKMIFRLHILLNFSDEEIKDLMQFAYEQALDRVERNWSK